MQIRCTSCGKTLQIDDKFAGKKVKCPCSAILQVPAAGVAATQTAAVRSSTSPAAVSKPPAKSSPSAFGIDQKEMSSLFDELTADDMIVKGKSTDPPKEKKKKDPLAAYGGSSIPSPSSGKVSGRSGSSGNLNLASQNQRFVAFLLDNLFVGMCNFAIGIGTGIVMAVTGNASDENMNSAALYANLFSTVFVLSYYTVLEATLGRTLGKLAAGTRVVSENGDDASIGQLIGRTLCRFIPFDPISFLFGKTPAGWHDKISGTRVISIQ